MKILYILSICIIFSVNCNSSVFCDKIQTKDFSVYVRNGDWGLQLKMGMEKELVNSPDWYSLDLGSIEN